MYFQSIIQTPQNVRFFFSFSSVFSLSWLLSNATEYSHTRGLGLFHSFGGGGGSNGFEGRPIGDGTLGAIVLSNKERHAVRVRMTRKQSMKGGLLILNGRRFNKGFHICYPYWNHRIWIRTYTRLCNSMNSGPVWLPWIG